MQHITDDLVNSCDSIYKLDLIHKIAAKAGFPATSAQMYNQLKKITGLNCSQCLADAVESEYKRLGIKDPRPHMAWGHQFPCSPFPS